MKEQRRKNQSKDLPQDEYQQVYLEPIEDPGFDDIPDADPLFHRKDKKRKTAIITLLCCVIALSMAILTYIFVSNQRRQAAEIEAQLAAEEALRLQQEQQKAEFEALANSDVFLDGISINGVAIGGMTYAEAQTALQPVAASLEAMGELQLLYGEKIYSVNTNQFVSSSNLSDVLNEAYHLGKTGDYAAMKAEAENIKTNGRVYTLDANYDLSTLTQRVAEIAVEIDTVAKNAAVESVDTDAHTIVFSDAVAGVTVQQEALVQTISAAVTNGNKTPIQIPVIETQPTVTKETLAAKYVQRATFSTDFSTSTSERKYNINKGAGLINGTIMKPDEVFSTNDTLGTRTTKNGWKMAGAYENGATVEQAGGGVCQLSTTLYNTVVKADLEIVFRRNHSMPVAYIDKGLDATINSVGNIIDFKFKNNTGSDLVIFAYTTNNKKLTFEVWGVPFATDEYDEIKLTSKKLAEYEPSGLPTEVLVEDGTIAPGEQVIKVPARKGYLYQSYKNYYKAGTLVRSEELASSTYKAFNGEIWIGPALLQTPVPESTPIPGLVEDPVDSTTIDPIIGANSGVITGSELNSNFFG